MYRERRICRVCQDPTYRSIGTIAPDGHCYACNGKGYREFEVYRYVIDDDDIGIDYRDCGPWRSYRMDSYGDTREELIANATIAEVDQDGGELDCYGLADAPNDVYERCEQIIDQEIESEQEAIDAHVDQKLNASHGWQQ